MGVESSVAAQLGAALERDTELILRRIHVALAGQIAEGTTAEDGHDARRRAALDLAVALRVHFRAQPSSDCVSETREQAAAATLDAAPALVPAVAGKVLSELFGEAVGEAGRRERGAIYTPGGVVEWMVREALEARLVEALAVPRGAARALIAGEASLSRSRATEVAGVMLDLRVLDPAAGAGAFLVGSAHVIAWAAQRMGTIGVPGLEKLTTPYGALTHCCRGFDIDPDSAEVAGTVAVLSTVSIDHALDFPNGLVSVRNPLIEGLQHDAAPDGWDLIVMNPPYVGEKHIRDRLGAELAASLREAHGFARDLLVHFALSALDALRSGGAMSAIISDTSFTMETATELRRRVMDEHRVHSIAWCRPFARVAVRGGILTVARSRPGGPDHSVEWVAADDGSDLWNSPRNTVDAEALATLPSRPFFRPTKAATAFIKCWSSVDGLDHLWQTVAARRSRTQLDTCTARLEPGDWTLLGMVVRSGQGLATGDDRRYIGYVRGTPEATAAEQRAGRIVGTISAKPEYRESAAVLSAVMASGASAQDALVELVNRDERLAVPGRKPFRIVDQHDVRTGPLGDAERSTGIAGGPHWIPYETSDRSTSSGGARWLRTNATVIDWSTGSVALLHQRRGSGDRRPVLRNQDLWFRPGVTHNRVTSYLRARRLPAGAIFSSESPAYVPVVDWLDEDSLLALLNSSLIEFAVKTFLASRNHIEVGHIRRLPVPVLDVDQKDTLASFTQAACDATMADDRGRLLAIEASLDEYVRELYGVSKSVAFDVVR